MKIPAIKRAVEIYSIEELIKAETDLMEEINLMIDIEGADEGEKLTHVLAAIWIKNDMKKKSSDFNTSLRAYTQKVRTSIN